MSGRFFYSFTTHSGKEAHLHETCTLTGKTCLRDEHNCRECDMGIIAERYEAKHGGSILDVAKSPESAQMPLSP